jgi:hypothetical protein
MAFLQESSRIIRRAQYADFQELAQNPNHQTSSGIRPNFGTGLLFEVTFQSTG